MFYVLRGIHASFICIPPRPPPPRLYIYARGRTASFFSKENIMANPETFVFANNIYTRDFFHYTQHRKR